MSAPKTSRNVDDTALDRRRVAPRDGAAESEHPRRRSEDRSDASQRRGAADSVQRRRSTRDGRQPLVVYMQPAEIKALKIAALEHDTTAAAIVGEAVSTWLRTQHKRRAT